MVPWMCRTCWRSKFYPPSFATMLLLVLARKDSDDSRWLPQACNIRMGMKIIQNCSISLAFEAVGAWSFWLFSLSIQPILFGMCIFAWTSSAQGFRSAVHMFFRSKSDVSEIRKACDANTRLAARLRAQVPLIRCKLTSDKKRDTLRWTAWMMWNWD